MIRLGKKELRINRLIELLHANGRLSIKDAATLLQVSEMTIRRDLSAVESSQLIRNVNGILISYQNPTSQYTDKEYDLLHEGTIQNEAKQLIGKFAAQLVCPQDFVIFDTGSTTEQIISYIPAELNFGALCFNRNILDQLSRHANAEIAFAGGYYHKATQMFTSEEGVQFIQNIRANKVFVSAAGIHESLGISCANSYEVPTKRVILKSAKQHILVADSSKFGVVRSSYFCDLDDIDVVVTDNGLPPEWISLLRGRGITLHIV